MAQMNMVQAIDRTIIEEMRRDPTIFTYAYKSYSVFGSIALSEKSEWPAIKKEFGWDPEVGRIGRTGICETQMIGAGVGAALAGTRPIIMIGTGDFILDGFGQLVLQAAKMRFKLGHKLDCPLVLRARIAGGDTKTVHHSGAYHHWYANAPGLLVAVPSTPTDAVGLWRTTLREAKDPVVMVRDSGLKAKESVPEGDYTIPFGKADIKREGSDVTIAGVGYWIHVALDAAEDLAKEGIDAEVWDPRTLKPFDRKSLIDSVRKTGAMVVIDQAPKTFGTTGEFMASVAEALTPVPPMARLATMDVPIAAAPSLTAYIYPNKNKIIDAVKGVLGRKNGGSAGMQK